MRTHLPLVSACLVFWISTATPQSASHVQTPAPREYSGVYISTPEEDYFVPCGVEGANDGWSLRFRDDEPRAPFLKKVTAIRGLPAMTHFIRVRGMLGPAGRYNVGFQTRQLVVDSVLEVKESLEPCAGFGVPAGWSRLSARFANLKGAALTTDRRVAALMDMDGRIRLWSTETGRLLRSLGSVARGHIEAASYGPMGFSDDGKLLAAGGNEGVVRVWQARDGKLIFSLKLKNRADVAKEMAKIPPRADAPGYTQPLPPDSYTPARQITFNKQGTMLATTNLFSTIVWSMKTGKKLAEFKIGTDFQRQVFFVGRDGLLMTADSGRMTLRSYLDADPVTRPGTRARATERMTLSPDGHTFAVNGWGDSVFLWSLSQGPGPALPVPPFVSGVIAFSPDGKTIATSGGMFSLYLWDVRTGAPIKAFHNFPGALSHAWFSADGKSIITLSTFDDRFRIVYIDPGARPADQPVFDDSLTARIPLGPPPSTSPRTIGGVVTGTNQRAVAGAAVEIINGDAPDSVVARTVTSPGGYFSFNGIRFRHILIRVRAPGFAPGIKYIHGNRWENDGPWGIELSPSTPR
jgi:WD40 repeat protein